MASQLVEQHWLNHVRRERGTEKSDECFMMHGQNVTDKPDLAHDGNLRGPVGYSTMGLLKGPT